MERTYDPGFAPQHHSKQTNSSTHTWSFHCVLLFGCSFGVDFTAYMIKSKKQMMFLMQVNGKLNFDLKREGNDIGHFVLLCLTCHVGLADMQAGFTILFQNTPCRKSPVVKQRVSFQYISNIFLVGFSLTAEPFLHCRDLILLLAYFISAQFTGVSQFQLYSMIFLKHQIKKILTPRDAVTQCNPFQMSSKLAKLHLPGSLFLCVWKKKPYK